LREEEKLIEEVCKKIKEIGKIGEDEKQKLYEVFGKRFRNALKALDEEAIKKYVFKPVEEPYGLLLVKRGIMRLFRLLDTVVVMTSILGF